MNVDLKKIQQNPTGRNIVIVCLLWLFGTTCALLAATAFFTEPLFQKKNMLFLFLILFALIGPIRIIKNYFKLKSQK
jgi:hypothetical protein